MNILRYFASQSKKIDRALSLVLPKEREYPPALHAAMRYAVFSGGKRIRPILALAACEAVGGESRRVIPAACALELVHSYSLVHDDLPCMDNDEWRRGKPTCFKKFGEDTAVLAGDALLTLAFKILALPIGRPSSQERDRQLDVINLIAEAVGSKGMVGGQAMDMKFQKKEPDLPTMEYINTQKTGALIAVSLKVGAILGGGSLRQVDALYHYGRHLGLLFQIVDDILDKEGYAKAVGVSEAYEQAQLLHRKALLSLSLFGTKATGLRQIADFVLKRKK